MAIFNAEQAYEKASVSRHSLSRWASSGKLYRVGRGLYMHPDCPIDPAELDFAVACKHFGEQAGIAGASALFHYGLITQVTFPPKVSSFA
ncbi:MAG: type IV toxin-antitoxin system AbiEi family antitoxin domain-containing protein [Pseudomonadota bacterium]|nr:type IV toxin-antitoxin system AbiEi family antitoxin domain-containing protein [Pseudomonadota bacterium]